MLAITQFGITELNAYGQNKTINKPAFGCDPWFDFEIYVYIRMILVKNMRLLY